MGHCLIVKEWVRNNIIDEVSFTENAFWVKIHNVQLEMLTKENALKIVISWKSICS